MSMNFQNLHVCPDSDQDVFICSPNRENWYLRCKDTVAITKINYCPYCGIPLNIISSEVVA